MRSVSHPFFLVHSLYDGAHLTKHDHNQFGRVTEKKSGNSGYDFKDKDQVYA